MRALVAVSEQVNDLVPFDRTGEVPDSASGDCLVVFAFLMALRLLSCLTDPSRELRRFRLFMKGFGDKVCILPCSQMWIVGYIDETKVSRFFPGVKGPSQVEGVGALRPQTKRSVLVRTLWLCCLPQPDFVA